MTAMLDGMPLPSNIPAKHYLSKFSSILMESCVNSTKCFLDARLQNLILISCHS